MARVWGGRLQAVIGGISKGCTVASVTGALFCALLLIEASCATSSDQLEPEIVKVDVIQDEAPVSLDPVTEQLNKLLEKVGDDAQERELLADVILMLEARVLESKGDYEGARAKWGKATGIAQNAFANYAFSNWVRANALAINKPIAPDVLARLLLAQAEGQPIFEYLKSRKLTALVDLTKRILPHIPDAFVDSSTVAAVTSEANKVKAITLDSFESTMRSDPYLEKTAAAFCRNPADAENAMWASWRKSIPPSVRRYWQAMTADCGGNSEQAREHYNAAFRELMQRKGMGSLAINSLYQLIRIDKSFGDRRSIADHYQHMVKIWQDNPPINGSPGEGADHLKLREVNDIIWAARYRALVGEYDRGREFCALALERIERASIDMLKRRSSHWRALMELKAEAYHVRSFRIALETRDYQSAYNDVVLGLAIPKLKQEWIDRFQWYQGVYQYLGGDFAATAKHWESLLAAATSDASRARLRYWLARTYDNLNMKEQRDVHVAWLVSNQPLGFYSVVGLERANLAFTGGWREIVQQWDVGDDSEQVTEKFDLRAWRAEKRAGPLLRRAEVLALSRIPEFASFAVRELETYARATFSVAKAVDGFVYLTRLQYAAGDYFRMISLLSDLTSAHVNIWQRYPRELGVFFPMPLREKFFRASEEFSQFPEALLAVTRQESAFNANALSPAGAIGLMQMIPETGRRTAAEVGMSYSGQIEDVLYDPASNVRLGAAYMKKLSLRYGGFMPAVFGAYNAGEEAVDAWLERRHHTDPMMWVELIPFSETNQYAKNVWRNLEVYRLMLAKIEAFSSH